MNDFETVRACIEGAARLGLEPFIDGPAALDRIEARMKLLEFAEPKEYANAKRLEAEVERLRAENRHLVSRFRAALDERDRLRAQIHKMETEGYMTKDSA